MADTPATTGAAGPSSVEKQAVLEKATAVKTAHVEAATAVAEGIKRVADAMIAEVQKHEPEHADHDFQFTGVAGGTFRIQGPQNLGSSGTVKLGSVQLHTTEWSTDHIEGKLPAGVVSGEVTVSLDDKTVRRGYFKA